MTSKALSGLEESGSDEINAVTIASFEQKLVHIPQLTQKSAFFGGVYGGLHTLAKSWRNFIN
jgi:hypothetical protein